LKIKRCLLPDEQRGYTLYGQKKTHTGIPGTRRHVLNDDLQFHPIPQIEFAAAVLLFFNNT